MLESPDPIGPAISIQVTATADLGLSVANLADLEDAAPLRPIALERIEYMSAGAHEYQTHDF